MIEALPLLTARFATSPFREVPSRVDVGFGQRSQRGPCLLHLPCQHEEIGRIARQPVGGRRDDQIARGERLHQPLELRAVRRRAGEGVGEDADAAGGFELPPLHGQVLPLCRYPRIAVNHAAIMHRIYATKKPNDFSGRSDRANVLNFAPSSQ